MREAGATRRGGGRRGARGFGRGAERGGFLLLTIMVLLFVATLMVGWGLKRATMQSRITDLRVEDYRLHHERMGLIAIAERWMGQEKVETLEEHATSSGRHAYWATLPNDVEISIAVADGQGTLCGRTDAVVGNIKDAMLDALTRIPPGMNDLIRDVGPVKVSLRAAPDAVLRAVAADDASVVKTLEKLRADLPESDDELRTRLTREDFDTELSNRLIQLLTVEPTLWRLDAEVRDEYGLRRYQIMMEFRGNRTLTHACRMLPQTEEDRRDRRR